MSYNPKIVEIIEILNKESGLDTESNHQCLKNLQHGFQKLNFAHEYLKKSPTFNNILEKQKTRKSNEDSDKWRATGIQYVQLQKHIEALQCFTRSVACAENGSENLSEALATRAKLLHDEGYYSANSQDPEDSDSIPVITDKHNVCSSASNYIELKSDEIVGRHFIAARDIPLGETLVVEKSFVHTIFPESQYLNCHECLRLIYDLIPCPHCTSALYCSDNCMEKAENYHKYECKVSDLYGELTLNFIKLVVKALEELKEDKYSATEEKYSRFQEIATLVTNEEKRNGINLYYPIIMASNGFYDLQKNTTILSSFTVDENELKNLIYQCIMIDSINSFNIKKISPVDGTARMIALGVYSFSSFFNHHCRPNCNFFFNGRNIVIKTSSNVKKGEECNISYCGSSPSAVKTSEARQRYLEDVFFFKCHCNDCLEVGDQDDRK